MTESLERLRKYKIRSAEDTFGHVRDILVEEETWTIRWLVLNTGSWLTGQKVLISPMSVKELDQDDKECVVSLSKEHIESSPPLDHDAPVSRQYEKTYFDHYQWPYYWMGDGLWGSTTQPEYFGPTVKEEQETREPSPEKPSEDDPVLRSGHELSSYRLESYDEKLGYIEDIQINTTDWSIENFVMDTRKWFHGKTILLSPSRVQTADWSTKTLKTRLSKAELNGKTA